MYGETFYGRHMRVQRQLTGHLSQRQMLIIYYTTVNLDDEISC